MSHDDVTQFTDGQADFLMLRSFFVDLLVRLIWCDSFEGKMAYDILDEQTGEDIYFKCRNFCVGGKTIITLGDYNMPVAEFVGLLIHHFRQDFPKDDLRTKWKNNLPFFKMRKASWDGYAITFPNSSAVDSEPERLGQNVKSIPSFLNQSLPIRNSGDVFTYAKYSIGSAELIRAIEYLFDNYGFESYLDPRWDFLEALIPGFDAVAFWKENTKKESEISNSPPSRTFLMFPFLCVLSLLVCLVAASVNQSSREHQSKELCPEGGTLTVDAGEDITIPPCEGRE